MKTILRDGRVIDPSCGVNRVADLIIEDGKIAGITDYPGSAADGKIVDVSGLVVTPGVVDIHTHLYVSGGNPEAWAGDYSVWPDSFSFRSGITTMVDAGSAGRKNFSHFRTTVIERSKTRIFALINIAGFGMISDMIEQTPSDFDWNATAEVVRKHSGLIVGIKSAHYFHPGWESVDCAMEAGKLVSMPVMVDFGYFVKERPYWELVKRLRPGDISTHCFRGPVPVVDEDGKVYPYLFRARDRGVKFDLGHGAGSFLFRNAVPAVEQGFYPDSISSDLHVLSMNAAMMDMPTCMSKCLAMGMPLGEVIARSTNEAAKLVGHPELGTLKTGSPADVAVWNLSEGRFGFKDSVGGRIDGKNRFVCEMTFLNGEVMWDLNARDAVPYAQLPMSAGVREPQEWLFRPEGNEK